MTSLNLSSSEDLLRQPCGDVEVVDGGVTIVAYVRALQAFASHNNLTALPRLSAVSSIRRRYSVDTVNIPLSARCKVVCRRLLQGWATTELSVALWWRNGRRLDLRRNLLRRRNAAQRDRRQWIQ